MGIPLGSEQFAADYVRDLLLQTHSALVQATNEQQIIAAVALCADLQTHLRLYYLELDAEGTPIAAQIVASWKDGSPWESDPILEHRFARDDCPLIALLENERDPVYFADDVVGIITDNPKYPCLSHSHGLVALTLVGNAHIEQPSRWHGIVSIGWPTPHTFSRREKYIYASIWETLSAVVSNHRLRLEALTNVSRLKELDRLKSIFLQSVSHELRTPLTAVITTTGGILAGVDGELSDDLKADVELIHQSGEHLLAVINDLLDMASIEAGKLRLYPQVFSHREGNQ